MNKTIYKINKILKTFNAIPTGFGKTKATKFKIRQMVEPDGASNVVAHHQGIEVVDGNANFLITGSAIGHPGYFHVVKDGKGYSMANGKKHFEIDIAYTHPGGIQAAEHILAVGNEQYNGATTYSDRSVVKFYDISNEDKIKELKHLKIQRDQITGYKNEPIASAVGITKNKDQWMLSIRSKNTIDFYSLKGDPNDPSNKFKLLGKLDKTTHHLNDYQSIYLYFSQEEKLYLFGMPKKTENDDKCFLHLIKTESKNDAITKIVGARTLRIKKFKRNGSGPRFKYASCIEFIPDDQTKPTVGKLRIYSIEADINNNSIRGNYWST